MKVTAAALLVVTSMAAQAAVTNPNAGVAGFGSYTATTIKSQSSSGGIPDRRKWPGMQLLL